MKYYFTRFGAGDPRTTSGLSPTFLIFVNMTNGATVAPPTVTESLALSGLYQWQWGTTQPIAFLLDAATTSPGTAGRYVTGQLDPVDRSDELIANQGSTLIGVGTTLVGIGVTLSAIGLSAWALAGLVGDSSSSFGSTSIDPTTVFGFLKRAQEISEGNMAYAKNTGVLDFYSRGSSTLLREKQIAETTSQTTKT